MSKIKFIYNSNKLEIPIENLENVLVNHIEKILQNGYEKFLEEIEFTDEEIKIKNEVNFGQYNQNIKRIIIRKDAFNRLIDTLIHEVFHVKFAMDYSHILKKLNCDGVKGYDFINEFVTIINTTMYLFKLDLIKYEAIFLDEMEKYKNIDEEYIKSLKSINDYEDIMISLGWDDTDIDELINRFRDIFKKEANLSQYKIAQKYANIYIVNEYYKIEYPFAEDSLYNVLDKLKKCKVTPEICYDVLKYIIMF